MGPLNELRVKRLIITFLKIFLFPVLDSLDKKVNEQDKARPVKEAFYAKYNFCKAFHLILALRPYHKPESQPHPASP